MRAPLSHTPAQHTLNRSYRKMGRVTAVPLALPRARARLGTEIKYEYDLVSSGSGTRRSRTAHRPAPGVYSKENL